MLNLIADNLPVIEDRARHGSQVAQECILFYQLATEKGRSHAAAAIARDKFLLLFPEYANFQEALVVLPPVEEDGPPMGEALSE
jgi:hypothetical protein